MTFTTRQRPMIPLRTARSIGILGRGLRCHRARISEKQLKALKTHQVLRPIPINTISATGIRCAAVGIPIQRLKQCWDGERRLPTAVWAATYSNNRRHCSGHSGGPGDKRWQAKEKGDKQEPYTFLDRGDHERLTEKSSERDLANKSADEEVDFKDMTIWQRVKYVRSKAKLMWKRYGLVAIGTSVVLYVGGFGILYTLLASGAVDPNVDISDVVQQVADLTGANRNEKLSEYVERVQHLVRSNKQYEHIFLSFIVNEALELPRDVIVLFVTPPIARALGRAPPIDSKGTR